MLNLYIVGALLMAPVIFMVTEYVGQQYFPRPPQRMLYSVLAAAVWPILAVGVVQFGVIVAAQRFMRGHADGYSSLAAPSGVRVGTPVA